MAYDHAMKYLQDGVAEAGTWTRASVGGHQDLLKVSVGLPRRKSASWMWYRGFSPDSTTRVYVFASFNDGSRHFLLNIMPSRGSSSCFERICGGRSMTWLEATWRHACPAMTRLGLLHLDDSVGEGPHTLATRIGAASRASTWGWIASTMRMKQNLVQFVS